MKFAVEGTSYDTTNADYVAGYDKYDRQAADETTVLYYNVEWYDGDTDTFYIDELDEEAKEALMTRAYPM